MRGGLEWSPDRGTQPVEFALSSHLPARTSWVVWGVVLGVLGASLLSPATALSQSEDPCLKALADSETAEHYDQLVADYLGDLDAGRPESQLEVLDEIWSLCTENLRIVVFQGDAHALAGRCNLAMERYYWVLERWDTWPHADNGADAKSKAQSGLATLKKTCLAEVRANCPTGASVKIGDEDPQECPAQFEVPAGSYPVVVSQAGKTSYRRDYELRVGLNTVDVDALSALATHGEVAFTCATNGTELVLGAERLPCPTQRTLEPGPHEFTAIRTDGKPFSGRFDVVDGQTTAVFVPSGQVSTALLSIRCSPATALVTLLNEEGTKLVSCPVDLDLPTGNLVVAVALDGYETFRREVVLAEPGLELQVALTPHHNFLGLLVRAYGGVALEANNNSQSGTDTTTSTSAETPTRETTFAASLETLLTLLLAPNSTLAFGARLRLGFGPEMGTLGSAITEYGFQLSVFRLFGALTGGYGTLGAGRCPDVALDAVASDGATCDPSADADNRFLFSFRFGMAFDAGAGFGVGFGGEFFFDNPVMVDILFGADFRF